MLMRPTIDESVSTSGAAASELEVKMLEQEKEEAEGKATALTAELATAMELAGDQIETARAAQLVRI